MTMLEMSQGEENETIECYNPECRWKGRKGDMISRYIAPKKKFFLVQETVEGYEYSCPKCGKVLMTSTI